MAGMLRFKDEKDFDAMMKRSRAVVHSDTSLRRSPREKQATLPPAPREREVSEIEELLAGQISAVGNLPAPIREYPFLRGRAPRLDFAWPEWTVNGMQLGVEVQGMAHRIKSKFSADLEKRALGMLQGWLILEVGGDHIRSGKAMEWLQELFTKAQRGNA